MPGKMSPLSSREIGVGTLNDTYEDYIKNREAKKLNFNHPFINYEASYTLLEKRIQSCREANNNVQSALQRYPFLKKWQELQHRLEELNDYINMPSKKLNHLKTPTKKQNF